MPNYISEISLPDGSTYSIKDKYYSSGNGISFVNGAITNIGVTDIITGATNGTVSITKNGASTEVAVYGLGSAAFTNANEYATALQGTKADQAMPIAGGTFSGQVAVSTRIPTSDYHLASKYYVDNNVAISNTLSSGTLIGTLKTGSTTTELYAPAATSTTIQVIQAATSPVLEIVESTNTSASATLTGVLSTSSLTDGQLILYKTAYATPGTALSFKFTYSTGTVASSYPLYIFGTTTCKGNYPSGTYLLITYNNNAFYVVNPIGAIS